MKSSLNRVAAIAAAALLTASACGSGESDEAASAAEAADTGQQGAQSPGDAPTGDSATATDASGQAEGPAVAVAQLDDDVQTMISNVAAGYERSENIWAGFVPNEHPTVLVLKDGAGAVAGAIAINHPDAAALGSATPIELDGLPFGSLHQIGDPIDSEAMDGLESFDFHAKLGGVDSLAMIASTGGDAFFDPTKKDYVSTLLHEMFHRYQDEAFDSIGGQDVEGYAYTAENLELAVLEERALNQALEADDDETRMAAAGRFAAVRLARLAADDRVNLDNSQETFEGTARYIEHRLAGDSEAYNYHAGNYDGELITGFDKAFGVKATFGFGRWYSSGAAVLRLLDLQDVDGVAERVEAGESPAEVLAAALDVTTANMDELVAEAKANYDPTGGLATAATAAAETARNEPPVFGDDPSGSDSQSGTTVNRERQ